MGLYKYDVDILKAANWFGARFAETCASGRVW